MTLTIRADCPLCGDEVRVPLLALDLAEGRFLSLDPEVAEVHVKSWEVTR